MADEQSAPPRRRRTRRASSSAQAATTATTATTASPKDDDGLDEVMAGFDAPQAAALAPKPPQDTTDYTGTQMTVHWGREHIQPFRFQGMDLGPFSMEVVVHEGETPVQASRRAMRQMNQMAQDELDEKLPRFKARCRDAEDKL